MLYFRSLFAIASAILLSKVQATFNATSHSNIIYYWGQNSAGAAGNDPEQLLWQKRLSHYCDSEDSDIIVVSFLHQFGQGRSTAFDLANSSRNCKGLIPGTQLMDCPQMEEDIKYCQSKNKKVILSLGGATPAYGVGSIKEGEDLADELWYTFAGGVNNTMVRPFGNATVDGFDLDIENGAKAGYTAFVNKIRKHYETDTSKSYYIAAAPQCPFPDYFVGDALNDAWFDFVMIQFYNNYCNVVNTGSFNYDIWDNWAKTRSINKNVRLFVGIPGSPSAASRGYVPYKQLVDTIKPLQSMESFGGIMVWDVSQAYGNTQDVLPNYADGIARLVKGGNDTYPPIEYSLAIESKSSIGTGTQKLMTTSTSTSTASMNTVLASTITATVTVPTTTTCSSFTNSICYSTATVVMTTTVSNPAISGQFTESAITTQHLIPYNITVAACGSNFTSIDNNSSNTSSLDVSSTTISVNSEASEGTANPSPSSLPMEGDKCEIEGSFKCSGPASFAQCVHGRYSIRNCAASTVCKENYDITPPSIYCGFP